MYIYVIDIFKWLKKLLYLETKIATSDSLALDRNTPPNQYMYVDKSITKINFC